MRAMGKRDREGAVTWGWAETPTLALGVADSSLSTLSSPPSPPHAIHPCMTHMIGGHDDERRQTQVACLLPGGWHEQADRPVLHAAPYVT